MRATLTAALVLGGVVAGFAQNPKCRVCEQPIVGKLFQVEDKAHGGKVDVCEECGSLESRCFACSIPVKPTATKLTDGRFLCARDAREAVQHDEDARKICLQARDGLDRFYSRFLEFPRTNVVVNIVDRFTLESLFKSPGYTSRCTSVFGATSSHEVGDKAFVHTISILSNLGRKRLEAVAAHEFGHTWLNENLPVDRKAALASEAVEGFCELIAFQWMELQRAEIERQFIMQSPYTKGQLKAFLTADSRYGFNSVLEWLQSGEAGKLDEDDPDAIRAVRATTVPITVSASPAAAVYRLPAPPPPPPEKLTLKGISGGAGRRLAIINDRTFGQNDLARMRLAKTNVLIRCLEIRTHSAVIRFEDTGEKQELRLERE
jgi:hypothetical protein